MMALLWYVKKNNTWGNCYEVEEKKKVTTLQKATTKIEVEEPKQQSEWFAAT